MAVTVIAARSLAPSEFGAFSATFAVYVMITAVTRAAVLEASLVRADRGAESGRAVVGTVLVAAVGWTALVCSVAVMLGGQLRSSLFALAAGLVPLLLVDAGRFISFSQRLPMRSLAIDAAWGFCAVLAAGLLASESSPAVFMLGWGLSSVVGAVMALHWTGRPRFTTSWMSSSWPLGWRYTVEWVAGAGAGQIAVLGLGAIAGLSAIGGLRAAQLLFGPLNILFSGAIAVLVPEGSGLEAPQLYRLARRASLGLVALSAATTLFLLAVPASAGESILGATWASADDLLMAVGVGVGFGAALAGPMMGIRALLAARSSLRLRLVLLPFAVVLPLAGAVWWGALGFAWISAAATGFATVCWWVLFQRLLSGDRIPETSARI